MKWPEIALSSGATANSGFIMTTAIGLGYFQGLSALMLPFSFFVGTLVFWKFFPEKINWYSHQFKVSTIAEILTLDFTKHKRFTGIVITILLVVATGLYTAAQWRASAISLTGFIDLDLRYAIIFSSIFVITYSSLGGFRSSVSTDVFQAIIMILMMAFFIFFTIGLYDGDSVIKSIQAQKGNSFFNPFNGFGTLSLLGFIIGWATASLGFSISQPQIVDKFYAAESEIQAKKAKWLYIGFVQITWMGMTIVGFLLSAVRPGLDFASSEQALSKVLIQELNPIARGLTLTAIFAAIASTADSLLISVSNIISNDLLKPLGVSSKTDNRLIIAALGIITSILSIVFVQGSVFDLVMSSILLLSASVAPAMIIKIANWKNSPFSILFSMLTGLLTSLLWKYVFELSNAINETVPAVVIAFLINYLVIQIELKITPNK